MPVLVIAKGLGDRVVAGHLGWDLDRLGRNTGAGPNRKGGKLDLKKTRTSDFFIVITEALGIRSGELWDFKHTERPDPVQADDYSKIKNHTDPKLDKVTSVNYLFPGLEWASKNDWLVKDYGFNIFYLDELGVMPTAPSLMN